MTVPIGLHHIEGFPDPAGDEALYQAAFSAGSLGPVVEIGATLFSIDHHRGSEENQPGWEYHDPELWDHDAGSLDTLLHFRRTIRRAGLEEVIIAVVGHSHIVAAAWGQGIGLLVHRQRPHSSRGTNRLPELVNKTNAGRHYCHP
jgi:MMP 1-O-methyltransferase